MLLSKLVSPDEVDSTSSFSSLISRCLLRGGVLILDTEDRESTDFKELLLEVSDAISFCLDGMAGS